MLNNNKNKNMLNVKYIKKLLKCSTKQAETVLSIYYEDYLDYCKCTNCLQYDLSDIYSNL